MNIAKFNLYSYKEDYPNAKYLPRSIKGFPVPNELLQFMDCLVSISYSDNKGNKKVNHNESEIGTKLLFAVLPCRNIEKFKKSGLTIKDLSYFCKGYSEKSIRKGATWLVKKGLFKKKAGSHNKAEFQVNYIHSTYEEISSDILGQIENDVKKEDVVFKGIRYLTTTNYKRGWDSKAIGHFTHVPNYFLPGAKSMEIKEKIVFEYLKNPFFDSIDGNTLKVVLQLAYKMHYNQNSKRAYFSPETEIKVATLMQLCGLSENKVESALKYLIKENFLRSYTIKRNSRKYIFNFRFHRLKKVKKQLGIRWERKIDKLRNSFTVTEELENSSLPVLDEEVLPVLPSQGDYNKDIILINIHEADNKNPLEEKEKKEENSINSYQTQKKEQDPLEKVKNDLLSYFRKLQIPYAIFLELNKTFQEMKDRNEKIPNTEYVIESYNNSQPDPSKHIIIPKEEATALEPVF